ncbi:MAG: dephospho-CoA kinase [Deltaproteobacteria bacterium]|nr:dephospho-CoA kinase [Deltaproteobacteria bacterium]MBI4796548.1 dephospho-CoA kinase [Deltaproteobacteria bacterium]
MFKIAITGGAGSGKSVVARMFQELGAAVLDADDIAHAVVAVGAPAWEELKQAFGPEYFLENGELNRARMARLVFADPQARQRLNEIVHPYVAKEIRGRLESLERQGVKMVLVEVPLLFEARLAGGYDRIIVVDTDPREQVQRLQARDHRDPQEIQGIIDAQMPLQDKVARADYVVNNRGSLAATRGQVEIIWHNLQKIILTENWKKVSVPTNLP